MKERKREKGRRKNKNKKIQLGFVSGVASTENFRSKGARASLLSLSSRRRRVRVKKGARTKSERERERESSRSPKQSHLCVVVVEEKERKHFVLGETRFINIRFKYKTFDLRDSISSPPHPLARQKEEE